jgi:hypothetical protein
MAHVKVIKFATGLEIIAKVVQETPTELVVDSPLAMQVVREGSAGINIGLMPFSWGGIPKDVVLSKLHVLCVLDPEAQLESQYLAGLAGIALPDSSTGKPKLTLVD